jgi:hypothetical protein
MNITFSSCFYIIKSKFEPEIYIQWMNNFISIVNNFYLVIYTDENSVSFIDTKNNPKIKVIIKPIEKFYNYKYKEYWKKNHEKNYLLRDLINWKINMLWCEKLWFVNETIENKYFDTEFYGWCDIGYFRNYPDSITTDKLQSWPNSDKIEILNKDKIYYACVTNNSNYLTFLNDIVKNKNSLGLPVIPIPDDQNSISGGFFILYKNKISWWTTIFDSKLYLYFKNDYLVKDDQIIILDCVLSNTSDFELIQNESNYNPWFIFHKFLL